MVDHSIRQTRLIVGDQRNDIFPGDIFRRYDHKLVPGGSRAKRDFPDPAPRNLAANGRTIEHGRQGHIIDVLRLSGDLVTSFFGRNGDADDAVMAHACVATSAAQKPPLRIRTVVRSKSCPERSRRGAAPPESISRSGQTHFLAGNIVKENREEWYA